MYQSPTLPGGVLTGVRIGRGRTGRDTAAYADVTVFLTKPDEVQMLQDSPHL